jgi:hypothetical protein
MSDGWKVLTAMFQGGGNIPQLLPIVARLVARGRRSGKHAAPVVAGKTRTPVTLQGLLSCGTGRGERSGGQAEAGTIY